MLFHEQLDIKLIRAVKANPVLYDHNHEKYMDFNEREVTWQRIGDELKSSAPDCKVRWINIRDVYRRILRKGLESGQQRPKLYKYENEISFLRPYYKDVSIQLEEFESDDRSNQGNDDCGDEGVFESNNSDEDSSEYLIERKPKITRSKSSKKKRRKRFTEAIVDPMSTPTFNEPTIPIEFESSDPVDAFLLSIGATLKTFSPYHLNLAKSKIFSIVQEHDLQQIVQKEEQSEAPKHDVKISSSEAIFL
ncbi:uncharacterized protein LOC123877211 [Maniola jurtina]|uniref:uncharacterized protein LOC123877211 n=1 Tax=Maniola jurtina TaxID=191418 RepID=UPI001E687083|nr:uncharacterized protein LOC123877211 [Maniola jurtina]